MANTQAIASGDLIDLVSSSAQATIYPNDDAILSVLQSRFRADLPYTRVGASTYIAVNPYKALASYSDKSRKEYEERCYRDASLPGVETPRALQPHVYELACRVYLLMRRRGQAQVVISRGNTGSGKSTALSHLTTTFLSLSSPTNRATKIASQIQAMQTVFHAFSHSKTTTNPSASRCSSYLELHFSRDRGRISGAKLLALGLDKSRLTRLTTEERSFHVFYQLLAGATAAERDALNISDPSDYALLAGSSTYRLPSGPLPFSSSDDATALSDLRASLKSLGFKGKTVASIFTVLIAILQLSNVQFSPGDAKDVPAFPTAASIPILESIGRLLGVSAEELLQSLTNKTAYVRKDLYTVILDEKQAAGQRDSLIRDLYAILFTFIVESINHKLAPQAPSATSSPPSETNQIILLDSPGFTSRSPSGSQSFSGAMPLVSALGSNGLDEFIINYQNEVLQSFIFQHAFSDEVGVNAQIANDGVAMPGVDVMDNTACVELLRGAPLLAPASIEAKALRKPLGLIGSLHKACHSFKSGKAGERGEEELLLDMSTKFTGHASFIPPPPPGGATPPISPFADPPSSRWTFGINHYTGATSYSLAPWATSTFIERDTDALDPSFPLLFKTSENPFVAKLFSGPGLSLEVGPRTGPDGSPEVVGAQVWGGSLREPSPILPLPHESGATVLEPPAGLERGKSHPLTTQLNATLSVIFSHLSNALSTSEARAHLWTLICLRPNDSASPNSFDKRRVRTQIRSLLLPTVVAKKSVEYPVVMTVAAFLERFTPRMQGSQSERLGQLTAAEGWSQGVEYALSRNEDRIWLQWGTWKGLEDQVRVREREAKIGLPAEEDDDVSAYGDRDFDEPSEYTHDQYSQSRGPFASSQDNVQPQYGAGGLRTPRAGTGFEPSEDHSNTWGGSSWEGRDQVVPPSGPYGAIPNPSTVSNKELATKDQAAAVEEIPTTKSRRYWLWTVWATTFWIPSFFLQCMGRMKRPDIRLAWREKFTIFWLIFLLNAVVIFYIVGFGILLCPQFDKAWSYNEVAQHTAENDFWVSIAGVVYDVTDFVGGQHSDIAGNPSNTRDSLEQLGGQDMTNYFPVPLELGCRDLVNDGSLRMEVKNQTASLQTAIHTSGQLQAQPGSELRKNDWYTQQFLPKIQNYRKGPLVWSWKDITGYARDETMSKVWAVHHQSLYDLSDYVYTTEVAFSTDVSYKFLNSDVVDVFKQLSGKEASKELDKVLDRMDSTERARTMFCLNNVFFRGKTDFRATARCQANNIVLLVIAGVLMGSMALKFLAALQLGSKRNPEMQDKFVLCQVPCYTEGEDSLRRTIDSLAALNYDDKRKLIFLICDGNIIGAGNDRTTPRIVLDILGVDPSLDPEPLLFKSVGEGSKALNYGKIYSGLYEFEGHVVPYMVVVKVGKPTERSKPGNRGKRDSQILLMHYLNRVHFDAPMSPMELEIYHQMRNVIGIDPAFYEYIFTIDADTMVTPDSLNRLVASSADDSSIIGICGETKLANEQTSWWTMIQVYEYYISHHLSKAFESLFGSVTCLPGCFSLYRIRTADKGRPIIISNRIIDEYSEPNVDTLHKKNLFSLGEDRYLTTLLLKHFPTYKTKFTGDAIAHTVAPESWRILFSQRRRWINSTIHNLCELVFLPELFGFCCFSMRFFVFIDLLSTLILPSTVVYLVYLIVKVSLGNSAFPRLTIIMLAVVYGLQAAIFIIKREFMLIGWMVVYILSYPVYSFFLPIYSFWCMDEFGWGNTRLVIGEGKEKKVIINEDEKFDESMIPLKKFSEYEAEAWETGSRRSEETGVSKPQSRSPRPPGSGDNSPHTYHNASQAGDYYRDTNLFNNGSSASINARLRNKGSASNLSHHSRAPGSQSQFGPPQIPFMPMGGGPPSITGSDYGTMPMMQPMAYQNTGSVYGMPMGMGMGMMPMTAFAPPMFPTHTGGSFGAGGSDAGGFGMQPPPAIGGATRPMSTFSMATTVNPFGSGPNMNPNPTDEELYNALKNYLSTQDLMTVTKKTAREAMATRFPKADLVARKDYLNKSIDSILSEA